MGGLGGLFSVVLQDGWPRAGLCSVVLQDSWPRLACVQ